MARTARLASLVVAALVLGAPGLAPAQPGAAPSGSSSQPSGQPAKSAGQGIAVLAIGPSRDDAFALARAIYGSRLRPPALDEVRARVLAGAPPPANASRELRELAEVRAGITGEDAAGRRLLAGLAQQVGAEALLVVRVERNVPPPAPGAAPSASSAPVAAPSASAGPPAATSDAGAPGDAGSSVASGASGVSPPEASSPAGNAAPTSTVVARLFLADPGEFDAARYAPEPGLAGAAAWKATVTSLEARFPPVSRAVGAPAAALSSTPARMRPDEEKGSPFYASGWFWGAVGGAALLGAAFYFATQDTSSDPIHLQMRVPK